MAKQNNWSTLMACIAVGLVAVMAMVAVIITGKGNNVSGIDTVSVESSSSDVSTVSSEEVTSSEQSKEVDTSSENTSSASNSSVTSSLTASSTNSNTAQMPENDGDKVCYLTFDDGPSSKVTPRILETLKKYNVKATFFVVGTGKMSVLKDIHSDGHAIGLHTDTHDYSIYKSTSAYFKDLQNISDKVYNETGVRSSILRFPGGSSNTVSKKHCKGIMTTLTKEVQERGYAYFDWNVDSNDANASKMVKVDGVSKTPKDTILSSVLNSAKNKDKICVLMHDISAKTTTADALPEIIEGLRAQGYRFDTLSTSAPVFHMKLNN